MSKGLTIHFSVHPTPQQDGEDGQTYHVRQNINRVIHSKELREHLSDYSLVTPGLFEMVIDYVEKEIAEQLLAGNSVHIDGLGRFSLQLGTRKVEQEDGSQRRKTYTSPDDLTGHEVVIEGLNFIADKQMLNRIKNGSYHFERDDESYKRDISRAELLTTLADFCATHGYFTRRTFEVLFGVSRYKADRILTKLVCEPYPKYYREKQGNQWVYRKTGT